MSLRDLMGRRDELDRERTSPPAICEVIGIDASSANRVLEIVGVSHNPNGLRVIVNLPALAGGGEAVAWRVVWTERGVPCTKLALTEVEAIEFYAKHLHGVAAKVEPLFTHPAGAVQVDEAMVSRMVAAFGRDPGWSLLSNKAKREKARAYLTAAINPGGSRE